MNYLSKITCAPGAAAEFCGHGLHAQRPHKVHNTPQYNTEQYNTPQIQIQHTNMPVSNTTQPLDLTPAHLYIHKTFFLFLYYLFHYLTPLHHSETSSIRTDPSAPSIETLALALIQPPSTFIPLSNTSHHVTNPLPQRDLLYPHGSLCPEHRDAGS